jgi:hypothetical protein
MRSGYFVSSICLFCAGAIFLFAAPEASADAVSIPVLPVRSAAPLSLFSPPAASQAEAPLPLKSTRSSGPLPDYRRLLPAPDAAPPLLVKNPFLPAAQ